MSLTTNLDEGDQRRRYDDRQSGSISFASVMLIMVGLFHAMQGFVALLNDEFYVVTQSYIFSFDVTVWAWIHFGLGLLVLSAGAALFAGATWARTVAVIAAGVSLVGNFAWLPQYPVWALCLMALDVFIIWAVTTHDQDFVSR